MDSQEPAPTVPNLALVPAAFQLGRPSAESPRLPFAHSPPDFLGHSFSFLGPAHPST